MKTENSIATARAGFTIVEMLIAAAIMMMASAMAIYGWIYVMRGERINSIQAELDMNVRMAIERIRSEVRLSAIDKIVFYPEGPGPYVAISFPVAFNRDDQGLTPMLSDTNILWDTTIIYHVDTVSTNRLLRTTFAPRDNDMNHAERMEQLNSVVTRGKGAGAEGNNEVASTRVIFANFISWSISAVAGVFDAYNAMPGKRRINFGSLPLGPGKHSFAFTSLGKNMASSGCKLGIDTLKTSAGACELEAEDLELGSCSPVPVQQPGYIFSGKNALVSNPGEGADVNLTLIVPNDRWTESNFRNYGIGSANVETALDETANDEVVRIKGGGVAWQATEQTGNSATTETSPVAGSRAYRILLQGSVMGWIRSNGRLMPDPPAPYSSGVRLRLPADAEVASRAFIGLAEPTAVSALQVSAGTFRELKLVPDYAPGGSNLWVLAGGEPMEISTTNNYVLSFWLLQGDSVVTWQDTRGAGGSMAAVRTNCTEAVLEESIWTDTAHVGLLNSVPFVQELFTALPDHGTFVSEIYDTTLETPDFTATRWSAISPAGTRLALQFRAGNDAQLADAPPWSLCAYQTNPDGLNMNGFGRFVQFRATFEPDATGLKTPSLRYVSVDWTGLLRMIDLGGQVVLGPDFGAFQLKVDDLALIKALRFELSIFKQLPGGSGAPFLTSSMNMEIEPRNSGK